MAKHKVRPLLLEPCLVALATIPAVVVLRKEVAGAAILALLAEAGDFAVFINLVVLKDRKLDLLLLVLDLLGLGVRLLLALLGTPNKGENKVEGRLLLDVVVRKCAAVLELLAGEDQALLVRGDTCSSRSCVVGGG